MVVDIWEEYRFYHQTTTLFTIITKQIHHRQTTKKKRRDSMNDYDYEMVLLRHTISTMYHEIIFKSCKKHNILQ